MAGTGDSTRLPAHADAQTEHASQQPGRPGLTGLTTTSCSFLGEVLSVGSSLLSQGLLGFRDSQSCTVG